MPGKVKIRPVGGIDVIIKTGVDDKVGIISLMI
jgi:hypothetical protein